MQSPQAYLLTKFGSPEMGIIRWSSDEYLVYTATSLIADVGGTVGLFLGWSVFNELSTLADTLLYKAKVIKKKMMPSTYN